MDLMNLLDDIIASFESAVEIINGVLAISIRMESTSSTIASYEHPTSLD